MSIKNNLFPVEIDFTNYTKDYDLNQLRLKAFKAVIEEDDKVIVEYINKNNVENTLIRQTPLMFAAYLGKIKYVQILLHESGMLDHNFKQAIDYVCKFGENLENKDEISKLLSDIGELKRE